MEIHFTRNSTSKNFNFPQHHDNVKWKPTNRNISAWYHHVSLKVTLNKTLTTFLCQISDRFVQNRNHEAKRSCRDGERKIVKTFHYHYCPCMTSLLDNISLSVHALRIANNINCAHLCGGKKSYKMKAFVYSTHLHLQKAQIALTNELLIYILNNEILKRGKIPLSRWWCCMRAWRRKLNDVNYSPAFHTMKKYKILMKSN